MASTKRWSSVHSHHHHHQSPLILSALVIFSVVISVMATGHHVLHQQHHSIDHRSAYHHPPQPSEYQQHGSHGGGGHQSRSISNVGSFGHHGHHSAPVIPPQSSIQSPHGKCVRARSPTVCYLRHATHDQVSNQTRMCLLFGACVCWVILPEDHNCLRWSPLPFTPNALSITFS